MLWISTHDKLENLHLIGFNWHYFFILNKCLRNYRDLLNLESSCYKNNYVHFSATLDPINGIISSKLYTFEGETQRIDDITKYIWQNHGIEEAEYKSIAEKEKNMEKAKLFYNFLLKSERKGFEFLLRAIQKFTNNSNCYKRYRKLFISSISPC